VTKFKTLNHDCDLCVIGGGMAGLCAAISASRHGARVVLMHDRPVFGGNASSECRIHICGADRHNTIKNMRETGILEEIRLENLFRNSNRNFSVWDTVLYEKVLTEPNITSLMNCSCLDVEMNDSSIASVRGWQLTTETYHTVRARIFADCSGDAILAPLTGADYRMGREARDEYKESIAPEKADSHTMGMTCIFQSRRYDTPQQFIAPSWAHRFESCDQLPYGSWGHEYWQMGYWWVELGGENGGIQDTEKLRNELLKITYGVWDHIKNHCARSKDAENWALEWLQFLPAKRESRRLLGAHVLTQNDITAEGRFEDVVAYGGWAMDDHHPAGFNAVKLGAPATIFHPAPSPYGIPYRCLYSRNIGNLMFAGRDASCTHAAMSSTRVMGTGCSMGQAVGTAAAIAVKKGVGPAGIVSHITELQQALLRDDAYLPWIRQTFSEITRNARLEASQGNPEPIRDGINRPVGNESHSWTYSFGDWIAYLFDKKARISTVTLVLDSALDQLVALSYHQEDDQLRSPPDVMPKAFRIEGLAGGKWSELVNMQENHQRLHRFLIGCNLDGIRFTLDKTWGAKESKMYAFYVD
jgi:hypothetical protein